MLRVLLLLIAVSAAYLHPVVTFAADRKPAWTKVSTPNFDLYTTAGERTGRRAIKHFETIRSFFQQSMPSNRGQDAKVRIVLFKNEKEYRPYSPNEVADAYYLAGHDYDTIVMKGFTEQARPIAVHEYMHLVTRHMDVKLPVWLNEGYATLYESMEGVANKVRVGQTHAGRLHLLDTKKWLEIERLTEVAHDSPEYNTKGHAGVFYAQSWALTHMLNLDPDYRMKARDFLIRMLETSSAIGAFADVYGKTPEDVRKDLRSYVANGRFFVVVFDVKLERYADQPEVGPADELEARLLTATLFSRLSGKRPQARESLEQLTRDFPEAPEPHEALAYLSWRADGAESAAQHFASAVARGSVNAKLYYDYAALRRGAAEDPNKRIMLLLKATRLRANYREAHKALAFEALRGERWGTAAVHFTKLGKLEEEEAFRVLSSSAYAFFKLKRWDAAKLRAEAAKRWAKSPEQIDRVDKLLEAVEWEINPEKRAEMSRQDAARVRALRQGVADRPPMLRRREQQADETAVIEHDAGPVWSTLDGELVQFDCLDGQARIHVRTRTETLALAIPDPTAIAVINGPGSGEFTCGEQEPRKVSVEYDATPDARLETIGAVKTLEFKQSLVRR